MKWRGSLLRLRSSFPSRFTYRNTHSRCSNRFSCIPRTSLKSLSVLGRRRKSICDCPRTNESFGKRASIGRSSDNRRFRFPNYSAWRRSQTESLLSRRPLFIYFSPLRPASFARSARLALLTTLRPRWGLALFDGLGSSRKVSR